MGKGETHYTVNLDSWAASSLLQKAIRRGEIDLAQHAASVLHRHRGDGVFRRLMVIAVEDVGIADVDVVWEVVRVATDKPLRALLGHDADHLREIVARLARAPKERSADYLFCAATKLPAALIEGSEIALGTRSEQISIAADPSEPLIRRAAAALYACSNGETITDCKHVERLLKAVTDCPESLANTVEHLGKNGGHAFSLMIPLLWSRWDYFGREGSVVEHTLAPAEFIGGIPSYAFDKHTSAGKRALARFARENSEVARILNRHVSADRHIEAVAIAAYYADSVPVVTAFTWPTGALLSHIGAMADMMEAGCPLESAPVVIRSVRDQLAHLNELRRAALKRSRNLQCS